MVSTLDSESNNPSSNLGRTFFFTRLLACGSIMIANHFFLLMNFSRILEGGLAGWEL